MSVEIFDVEQNTESWHALRSGLPTASEFSSILAKGEGKTRRSYMLRLAGEIITGQPEDTYNNSNMDRGHAQEEEIRRLYSLLTDFDVDRIGFVKNGRRGCSPDGLIGSDGIVQIKSTFPRLLIDILMKDEFPSSHKAQCQGELLVTEREWTDIAIGWPRMPLFKARATRDESYIKTLSGEIDRFNDELDATVERVRRYGTPQDTMAMLKASVEAAA